MHLHCIVLQGAIQRKRKKERNNFINQKRFWYYQIKIYICVWL